jgi:hypothetical protein
VSSALYEYAFAYPETAVAREYVVNMTYPTTEPALNRIWASSMHAWMHSGCVPKGWPLCNLTLAGQYRSNADTEWLLPNVRTSQSVRWSLH